MKRPKPDPVNVLGVECAALFLDLDGTVVPVAENPNGVRANPACRIVLKRACDHLHGRLAILSGRTIDSIDAVLGSAVNCISGMHGLQRRTPLGRVHLSPPCQRIADARAALESLARARPGLRVHGGRASVAIHYRSAPGAEAAVLEAIERLAVTSGLKVSLGDMVAELRMPAPDKGSALARFMYEAPFSGSKPIFLGDSSADEEGFSEAARRGGRGILVGPARPTAARGRLANPVAALGWIARSLDRGYFNFREADDFSTLSGEG